MVLTLIAADDEGKPGPGSGPGSNGNAQRKPNAANGESSTPEAEAQPQNPVELAAMVRAATYPDVPVDVLSALRGRGYAVVETDLGDVEVMMVKPQEQGVGGIILNSRLPEPVRRWIAAGCLYVALAAPKPTKRDDDGIAHYSFHDIPEADEFAAELLLPAADVNKVWAREATAGRDVYQAVKIVAGIFAVPAERARARAVDLGLITS